MPALSNSVHVRLHHHHHHYYHRLHLSRPSRNFISASSTYQSRRALHDWCPTRQEGRVEIKIRYHRSTFAGLTLPQDLPAFFARPWGAHIQPLQPRIQTHTHTHTRTHARAAAWKHTLTPTHTYAHTHTHTRTNDSAPTLRPAPTTHAGCTIPVPDTTRILETLLVWRGSIPLTLRTAAPEHESTGTCSVRSTAASPTPTSACAVEYNTASVGTLAPLHHPHWQCSVGEFGS